MPPLKTEVENLKSRENKAEGKEMATCKGQRTGELHAGGQAPSEQAVAVGSPSLLCLQIHHLRGGSHVGVSPWRWPQPRSPEPEACGFPSWDIRRRMKAQHVPGQTAGLGTQG